MTEIRIKSLRLENFKCHSSLMLDFMGGNASIYGDNATGKTSVYDALTWLLFGKDSLGNGEKNIEIKPLDTAGQVRDHDALTVVEAVLLVGNEEMSLRRTYKEVWTTKRGSTTASYDGNTSEYYINGVPYKKNVFQEKVNDLVNEDMFRMLTSVSYFASQISWQERRAVLFRVAGVLDDKQIIQTDVRFLPLAECMGKMCLEDYKKKLLAEKRKFIGAKSEIPARISECQKTIEDVERLDFAGAKAEVEALNAQKEHVEAQLIALDHNNAMDAKRMEIREIQVELAGLETENMAFRANQTTRGPDVNAMKLELFGLNRRLRAKESQLEREREYIDSLTMAIAESRERWISVNSETFAGGNCPTCGQVLPEKQFRTALAQFEAGKRSRLLEIEKTANSHKAAKAQAEGRLESLQEEICQLETEILEKQKEISDAESTTVVVVDIEGYEDRRRALQNRILVLNGELADMADSIGDVKTRLNRELSQIRKRIAECMETVNKESLLKYSQLRIEELRENARSSAECLEVIEKMLYLMEEYSRYKTRFVEESINGMFRIARFRLFREQANGGAEDRCDVVHDGVPYISVNNGMKINLGIDIINTLSMAFGVKVPLFLDNAESVTRLEQCSSQIIRLVVSENDKELRVHYEN